jgi:hypothetical protein
MCVCARACVNIFKNSLANSNVILHFSYVRKIYQIIKTKTSAPRTYLTNPWQPTIKLNKRKSIQICVLKIPKLRQIWKAQSYANIQVLLTHYKTKALVMHLYPCHKMSRILDPMHNNQWRTGVSGKGSNPRRHIKLYEKWRELVLGK